MNYGAFAAALVRTQGASLTEGTFRCRLCHKTYPNSENVMWRDVCLFCDGLQGDADRERREQYAEGE